jgi:hypothetical protein
LVSSSAWHALAFSISSKSASFHQLPQHQLTFRGISSKFGFPAASASAFALESAVSLQQLRHQLWLCIRSKSFVSFQYQHRFFLHCSSFVFSAALQHRFLALGILK